MTGALRQLVRRPIGRLVDILRPDRRTRGVSTGRNLRLIRSLRFHVTSPTRRMETTTCSVAGTDGRRGRVRGGTVDATHRHDIAVETMVPKVPFIATVGLNTAPLETAR